MKIINYFPLQFESVALASKISFPFILGKFKYVLGALLYEHSIFFSFTVNRWFWAMNRSAGAVMFMLIH